MPDRITIGSLDASDEPVARAILALQRESYAVEAALIGDDRIPPLSETIDELHVARLEWLGASDPVGLAGAVSWAELPDGTIDIHRLVVAPRAFRQGIATALLDALDKRHPGRRVVVSTGRGNGPALDLYRHRGFTVVRDREAIPGLWITELERPETIA